MAGRKPLAAAREEELYWSEQSSLRRGDGGSRETIVVNTAEETDERAQKQGETEGVAYATDRANGARGARPETKFKSSAQ